MQKHQDNFATRMNGNVLQPLSGVTVTVVNDATGLPATLYSDNGVTVVTSIVTDDNGGYAFYAADGKYTVTYNSSRLTAPVIRKLILEDPDDNPAASLAALAASTGGALVNTIGSGTGAVARTVQTKLRERVSVKDFGALGDGSTDDTTAIQAAATYAQTIRGCLVFPPCTAGQYYKITAPITFTTPISIRGDGANGVLVLGVGLTGGQYLFDFNCVAADVVEHIQIDHLTLRSNNAAPYGLRLKNASYVDSIGLRFYNLAGGLDIEGTRCFTHHYTALTGYSITNSTVRFIAGFTGGGQFNFNSSTFAGSTGFAVPSTVVMDSLAFNGCNWEQCTGPGLFIAGTCRGVSISGGRTEGGDTYDFVFKPLLAAEYISGINISGVSFSASDSGAVNRIVLGGDAGKVRGFVVSGCAVGHGTDTFSGSLVQLNGDGESGLITGNALRGTTCSVVSTQRAGVVVFGNENISGKLAEWWGSANWGVDQGTWTPIDGSGAGLSFVSAGGRYTKIGRLVQWQAFVSYPVTANASAAEIGGLPYAVGGLTGASEGRAGARVDVTNLGSAMGLLQGLTSNTELAFYNPTSGAAVTNVTLSGKYFYMSGAYSI